MFKKNIRGGRLQGKYFNYLYFTKLVLLENTFYFTSLHLFYFYFTTTKVYFYFTTFLHGIPFSNGSFLNVSFISNGS